MSIRLSAKRCEEIKNLVTKMYVDYGINCIPVNGFEIAVKMGVKLISYSSRSYDLRNKLIKQSDDGFCYRDEFGQWYIFYNDARSRCYGRINNTIMHEIGHIVLDHSEDSELAEKEVNFFAKYALTPPILIHKLKLSTAYEVAEIFGVSLQAAGYALNYYRKWLCYGGRSYTDYELIMMEQFNSVLVA